MYGQLKSSPRSWGCFCLHAVFDLVEGVFPTLVGVFPTHFLPGACSTGLPHARGGVSTWRDADRLQVWSSPRSWGCFLRRAKKVLESCVFPTLVGVFLFRKVRKKELTGLPHARGGVSQTLQVVLEGQKSSPRSWGCFYVSSTDITLTPVFPTLVGVFLVKAVSPSQILGLPHARGGVSWMFLSCTMAARSSPRSWGCFFTAEKYADGVAVFPTLVGVFLRGQRDAVVLHGSSPRSWGCFYGVPLKDIAAFVFPTLVGVFLCAHNKPRPALCLPHARGGVSFSYRGDRGTWASSPRSWGCFSPSLRHVLLHRVFPTLVGVFPGLSSPPCYIIRLPHARGGVSSSSVVFLSSGRSSPRSWGCFPCGGLLRRGDQVFPTLVGVFLGRVGMPTALPRLPHARGGVSISRTVKGEGVTSSPRSWGCFRHG